MVDKRRKVLFVDDQPNVLQGLKRAMRSLSKSWDLYFVSSAQEAIELMEKEPIDAVVTDMCMPNMNGSKLLRYVIERFPKTVRIVLSGYSSPKTVMDLIGVTHQYLPKPCDAETLKRTVERALAMRDILDNEEIKALLSRLDRLPSLPSLYSELVAELDSPDASIKRVGEIISKDVAMVAKILHLVNSAFFGLVRRVSSPTQAVALLGLDTIKALVLSIKVFSQFDAQKIKVFSLDKLWMHSVSVGSLARNIAKLEGCDRQEIDDSFMAGLLHDLGKLVLADNMPDQYAEAIEIARREGIPYHEAERRVFSASHAEVGACLLGLWGLPEPLIEAVWLHHNPSRSPIRSFSALTAVHIADVLAARTLHPSIEGCQPEMDADYISALGLSERMSAWEEECQKIAEG